MARAYLEHNYLSATERMSQSFLDRILAHCREDDLMLLVSKFVLLDEERRQSWSVSFLSKERAM